MEKPMISHEVLDRTDETYQAPRLVLIGAAIDVVLGPPGGGWDGPYGMSEPQFEFESDDDGN